MANTSVPVPSHRGGTPPTSAWLQAALPTTVNVLEVWISSWCQSIARAAGQLLPLFSHFFKIHSFFQSLSPRRRVAAVVLGTRRAACAVLLMPVSLSGKDSFALTVGLRSKSHRCRCGDRAQLLPAAHVEQVEACWGLKGEPRLRSLLIFVICVAEKDAGRVGGWVIIQDEAGRSTLLR